MLKPLIESSQRVFNRIKRIKNNRHTPHQNTSTNWGDDHYSQLLARHHFYQLTQGALIALSLLLIVALLCLFPLQRLQPLLVHHYPNGHVIVEPTNKPTLPVSQAQVESDLARYVIQRESYHWASYQQQYDLVTLLSTPQVIEQYAAIQRADNVESPINRFGQHSYQQVTIEHVLLLDQHNLMSQQADNSLEQAQVYFTVADYDSAARLQQQLDFSALITWQYQGEPDNPQDKWRNWLGFTVNHYTVQPRTHY